MTARFNGPHAELTEKVLEAAFEVSKHLGCGFLEKVYQTALALELNSRGLKVVTEQPLKVLYKGQVVGDYYADLVVNDTLIVELKATEGNNPLFMAQVINYLSASSMPVALLLNFGKPLVYFRRLLNPDLYKTTEANTPE